MRERRLGTSDLVVSAVGLGCNMFGRRVDGAGARAIVDAALGAGVTFFDTAESYGDGESERLLGRALAGRRDRAVIATKFGWGVPGGGSAEYVRAAIDRSLERLGVDHVDLYQYHRPDGVTPLEETLGALDELVRAGKVRHVGSSNFTAEQVRDADALARERGFARFVSAQNEYSLLARDAEAELVPALEELGLGLIPYFPLARGLLTGKVRRGQPPPPGTRLAEQGLGLRGGGPVEESDWDRLEALEAFARERGLSLLDVAIGGLAALPAVGPVIAGATSPEQVRANAAAGAWEPSPEELELLRAL
ncbi:MAG TPA: aldo/keto reductase [Gaiellaceae bacterium]|nr:aldo/keto reductase [Gaiellaceae bacterium]